MATSSSSQYIHISDSFFAVMNQYQGKLYVHVRNKFDKKKKLSMNYDDAFRVMLSKFDKFEKAAQRLRDDGDEEEEEGSDEDDRAYRECTDPPKKRAKM